MAASAWGFDMWDLSNQFVAEGVSGGLVTFLCFIAMIAICFSRLGNARKAVEGDRNQEWFYWFLGCALLSHMFAFFGISYFDHTQVAWFALLAMITAATARGALNECAMLEPASLYVETASVISRFDSVFQRVRPSKIDEGRLDAPNRSE